MKLLAILVAVFAGLAAGAPGSDSVASQFRKLDAVEGMVRYQAVQALEKMSRTSDWRLAIPFLRVGSVATRQMACKFIRNSRDHGYAKSLLERLVAERSPKVGVCLVNAVGDVARPEDVPRIAWVWRQNLSDDIRSRLLGVLGDIDSCAGACADTLSLLRRGLDTTRLLEGRLEEARARHRAGMANLDSLVIWWRGHEEFTEFLPSDLAWRLIRDPSAGRRSRARLLDANRSILNAVPCKDWVDSYGAWKDLLVPSVLPIDLRTCDQRHLDFFRHSLLDGQRNFVPGVTGMELGGIWGEARKDEFHQLVMNGWRPGTTPAPGSGEKAQRDLATDAFSKYLQGVDPSREWIRRRMAEHKTSEPGLYFLLKISLCGKPNSGGADPDICEGP